MGAEGQLMRMHGNFVGRRAFHFDAGLRRDLSHRWRRQVQRRRQGDEAQQHCYTLHPVLILLRA